MSAPITRDWVVVSLAILLGYLLSFYVDQVPGLPGEVVMVLEFPVSTGAMLAIVLEFVVPGRVRSQVDEPGASD
jgi:xanthine/uracil permease